MKGSIYKAVASNGGISWRYQIDAGRDESGKRIRISKSGFRLQRDAADALHEKLHELKLGTVRTEQSLKTYLGQWLPHHAASKPLAPKTAERYQSLAAHAIKALGDIPLKDLNAFMFDDLYMSLAANLSAKTIREVHNVIHVALKRAVKTKLIPFNPADGCDLPPVDTKEAIALNAEQLEAFQRIATGTWVDLFIRLDASIGARRGELLGDVRFFVGNGGSPEVV